MKFLKGKKQPAVVWDPKRNQAAAVFKNGEFETTDKGLIRLLTDKGYETVPETPETDEAAETE